MSAFLNLLSPTEALNVLFNRLDPRVELESIPTCKSLGRILAKTIDSPADLPASPRSTMDGYSVRALDTFGATETLPAYLELAGDVPMGLAAKIQLSTGQAAGAYTGGLLAHGADAVVMVENTQNIDDKTIEVLRPVAPGENVVQVGEDVRLGQQIMSPGHRIRPQDIGGLMALGITEIDVSRRIRVAVVSTGDELVPPNQKPLPGQIRDINTYTIAALVQETGGIVVPIGLVKDSYESQRTAAITGLSQADILLFSAGSSVSSRDMTAKVFRSLDKSSILAHGISHKPGKPTIIALVNCKPAFGLPGNPVSAVVVFNMIVRPTILALNGCKPQPYRSQVMARLLRDVASETGRVDHVPVRLLTQNESICAEPLFGKSNLIYTLVRADGNITIPRDKGGLYTGEEVEVTLSG